MRQSLAVSPQDLQESINHLSYDLKYNNKSSHIRGSVLNFFMGIMRKKGYYHAPENYTKEDLFKKELPSISNQDEENLIKARFSKWSESLSREDQNQIICMFNKYEDPESMSDAYRYSYIVQYFKERIWPTVREKEIFDFVS